MIKTEKYVQTEAAGMNYPLRDFKGRDFRGEGVSYY